MTEHNEASGGLQCEICLREIPHDPMSNGEVDEYVVHYFGLECYTQWREEQDQGRK
jgi:hypothetical protein